MRRAFYVPLLVVLISPALAGCLGDDSSDVDTGIPIAVVTVTPIADKEDTFRFDASSSTGRGLTFAWDLGDGTLASEPTVEHTYAFGSGTYSASLTITDLAGTVDVWEEDVVVGTGINAAPVAAFVPEVRYLKVNTPFTVKATATEDPDGDPVRYEWDFNYLMTEQEYVFFREAKANQDDMSDDGAAATGGDGGSGGSGGSGGAGAAVTPPEIPDVEGLLAGGKDLGHDGPEPTFVSLFAGQRTSDEPVFTLDEGFPDATIFYVHLRAVDVKGATKDIVSEEVWPVRVVETPIPLYVSGTVEGDFELGAPATVTDNTADIPDVYDDEATLPFTIEQPIIEMYVNVTWNQHDDSGTLAFVGNDVDLRLTTPNDKTREVLGNGDSNSTITLFLTADMQLGAGTWNAELVGRQGAAIDWVFTYWAKVDRNVFRDIEAPFVDA